MKATLRYYGSVFLRRLHWFLIPALAIAAVGIIVAMTLPPSYVSSTRFIVEDPQIPSRLAPPTVTTAPLERLQIIEQRLLARSNLIDVARRVNIPGIAQMSADDIAGYMSSRTNTKIITARDAASQMTISFEAPTPQIAAAVVNEYLSAIQRDDVESRTGMAGQTYDFFQQEADRLSTALNDQSAKILQFKADNSDALPEDQPYRQQQLIALQARLDQTGRDISNLTEQRARVVQIFQTTGQIQSVTSQNASPQEHQLAQMRMQLNQALAVYAPDNPRIRILKSQIAQLEATIAGTAQPDQSDPLKAQMAEIDGRIATLQGQEEQIRGEITRIQEAIGRATVNSVSLAGLQRDYDSIQSQYTSAQARLFDASTGERIERQARGQRITVIQQPTVPTSPSKPNRLMLAGAGIAAGLGAGLVLVVLLELLNRSPRRPEDIVKRLGIMPIATIPYIHSSREAVVHRSLKVAMVLIILILVPALVWSIHTYYQPLDVLAEQVKEKVGL
ncbi:lipopolysaccharide biosynthesis [Haematobacter missouriensis]|uniref:Lipopolysaccharide biosynthesis n=1 Tax=Haematobacter missouriensis TaxID=366616 RepID=A0A212ARC9_9RHOB|nr:lipopolysaccharide biosynthesis [Haematobacter missouriensis]OWJ84028.1 lipopolysaccharide biosynthesis [Haematobacter missouriensis]